MPFVPPEPNFIDGFDFNAPQWRRGADDSPVFNHNVVQHGKVLHVDPSPYWDDLRHGRDYVPMGSPALLAVEVLSLAALEGPDNVVEHWTVRRLIAHARKHGIAVYEKTFRESLRSAIAERAVTVEHTGYVESGGARRKGCNRYTIHTPVRNTHAVIRPGDRPDVYEIILADWEREREELADIELEPFPLPDLPF
jgi:hypothetical protein